MSYYNEDNHNFTSKEIWIGLIVLILSITLSLVFEPFAKSGLMGNVRKYELALPVTDQTQFQYAHQTQVGNVLAYGQMVANEPVSFDELKNGYSLISKIEQHYTMHTYTTCETVNKVTSCTTHVYWSWDEYGRKNLASATFTFLGEKFNFSDLNLSLQNTITLNSDTMYDLTNARGDY
jgi:hypothetical protein